MDVLNFLTAAILAGTPLLLGTTGEILTEKSGNLNLGVEGMMYMGAISGLSAALFFERVSGQGGVAAAIAASVAAFLAGALGALLFAFLTITLRANQNVVGLALTIFGTGFGNFFGEFLGKKAGGFAVVSEATKKAFSSLDLGFLSKIPVFGTLFFQHNWLVYFALLLALALGFFLTHTRKGLNLRALGDSPATADAAGVNVSRYKYIATVVGGGICGLGGMFISMVTCKGVWVHNCIAGYGWLSVALVIFATWSPWRALYCGLIFGGLTVLRLYLPIPGLAAQLYDMLPYIVTIIVLIITSVGQSKEHAMPASCGQNYFREER